MTPLPPVRKRTSYADIQADDLVFALFQDRIAPAGAMQLDSVAIKAHDDELVALDEYLDLVDALDEVAAKHMPGGHDQRSHGRSTARRAASRSAYSQARAGGASVAEARTAARDVSTAIANKQRMRNIERELAGTVSDKQRSSLEAEHARLRADTSERVSRASKLAPDAADVALNHNPEANNKGRHGKLNQLDEQHSYMTEQKRIAANKVADAQQKVDRAQAEYDRYIAQGVKPSKLTYEKRELAEAKRDLAHWKAEQRMVDKNAKQVEQQLNAELARPANLQRRADRAASDAWLAAYKEPSMTRAEADRRAQAARDKVLQEGAPKKPAAGNRWAQRDAAAARVTQERDAMRELRSANAEHTRHETALQRATTPQERAAAQMALDQAQQRITAAQRQLNQATGTAQTGERERLQRELNYHRNRPAGGYRDQRIARLQQQLDALGE